MYPLKLYRRMVPLESIDEELVRFLEAQYCADEVHRHLRYLKSIEGQIEAPSSDLFNNDHVSGNSSGSRENYRKAIEIKLERLLRLNGQVNDYLLELQEKLTE